MRRSATSGSKGGFTLIEVMAALVVFSLGVLSILGLSQALSRQMNTAALRAQVAITVQNRLDSLQLVPYDSLSVETVSDTVHLYGRVFDRTHRILQATALVREIEVTVAAEDGDGPELTASTFVTVPW